MGESRVDAVRDLLAAGRRDRVPDRAPGRRPADRVSTVTRCGARGPRELVTGPGPSGSRPRFSSASLPKRGHVARPSKREPGRTTSPGRDDRRGRSGVELIPGGCDSLEPGVDAEGAEEVADVIADRLLAEVELAGDLLRRAATLKEAKNLRLAWRQ